MADLSVDVVGEVNGGSAGRQIDHISPGGKDKDALAEQLLLQQFAVGERLIGVLQAGEQLPEPVNALILRGAGANLVFLVCPVSGNASFRFVVH